MQNFPLRELHAGNLRARFFYVPETMTLVFFFSDNNNNQLFNNFSIAQMMQPILLQ